MGKNKEGRREGGRGWRPEGVAARAVWVGASDEGALEGERERGTLWNVEKPHNWWCLISTVITIPLAPRIPNLALSYIHATFRKWLAGPLLLPTTHGPSLWGRHEESEFSKKQSTPPRKKKSYWCLKKLQNKTKIFGIHFTHFTLYTKGLTLCNNSTEYVGSSPLMFAQKRM